MCNFLGLACETGERRYLKLALDLIERVHHSLGRQRNDSGVHGWLSGLSEEEGEGVPPLNSTALAVFPDRALQSYALAQQCWSSRKPPIQVAFWAGVGTGKA